MIELTITLNKNDDLSKLVIDNKKMMEEFYKKIKI